MLNDRLFWKLVISRNFPHKLNDEIFSIIHLYLTVLNKDSWLLPNICAKIVVYLGFKGLVCLKVLLWSSLDEIYFKQIVRLLRFKRSSRLLSLNFLFPERNLFWLRPDSPRKTKRLSKIRDLKNSENYDLRLGWMAVFFLFFIF